MQIGLTQKGVDNYEEVIRLTFAFINKVRKEGPLEYIQKEAEMMGKIGFENSRRASAIQTSRSRASSMAAMPDNMPIEDLFSSPYDYSKFDGPMIQEYMDLMTPDNCYYILQAKQNEKLPDLKSEYYYDTKYSSEKLSAEKLASLATAVP